MSFLHFLTNVCAIVGGNVSVYPFWFMLLVSLSCTFSVYNKYIC